MNLSVGIFLIATLVVESIISTNVCSEDSCKCSKDLTTVNCDTKGWTSLNDKEFPSNVVTLTLVGNKLKFDNLDDLSKIENLTKLTDLSLNLNPLGIIPAFNETKIRSLSLQDASLISAEFPPSYSNSLLQSISLNNNKIRSIKVNDFLHLQNSPIKRLHIDSASLSMIDQNAFTSLLVLQALSLKNNQLKSCEFLSTFRLLSSIQLDGNQFTSLPQQLSSPKTIQTFSFTHNSISIIDESSPLNTWRMLNHTNIRIYLANNSFDCCRSVWFIRFLQSSAYFVADAPLLTCATPLSYTGQQLIKLNPDDMNCGAVIPDKSWWTTYHIIAVSVGGLSAVLVLITVIVIYICRGSSRSGYIEIGGVDDVSPSAPVLSSSGLPFPSHGEDDDAFSTYSTIPARNRIGSQAPTCSIAGDAAVIDNNQI